MTKAEIHRQLCEELHILYLNKSSDYGDSYSKIRDFMPTSILVRLHDKVNRVTTLMLNKQNGQKVKDESILDTLMDNANYSLIEIVEQIYEKQQEAGKDNEV